MTRIFLITFILVLGKASARNIRDISEVRLDYNGAPRTKCPASAHQGNQPSDRVKNSSRLENLRAQMIRVSIVEGPALDGYIVTSDDAHQSETVAPHDARREFVTGFSGSYGEALITANKAVFWTDGRYHIQADQQLNCDWTLMKMGNEEVPTLSEWLINEFQSSEKKIRIGADPTLIPAFTWDTWQYDLYNTTVKLVAVRNNLVDIIWQMDQPDQNPHPAFVLDEKFAGRPWQEKVRDVRLEMEILGADALVLTALDEIAWLFNIRGYDIPYTPVLRSYAVLTQGSIHLYVPTPERKLDRSVNIHLKTDGCSHADCVKIHNYDLIFSDLRTWSQAWTNVWLPAPCGVARGASHKIFKSILPSRRMVKPSPIIKMRSIKNPVEIRGMEEAHVRDGMAMCEILSYTEEQISLGSPGWDELQVSRFAKEMRYEQDNNMGISFATHVAYGAHAAIPHYKPTNTTNINIGTHSTLVIDSGGQYKDGTTDVTRTLHYGKPTQEQKEAYTRVLIGSIQLASLIFPANLRTDQLDVMAREPLWSLGLDYQHGTGHGVGHFLSVHEAPIGVDYDSEITECSSVNLRPGSFFSNEPGYYKEDAFGVRLENVLEVITTNMTHHSGEKFIKFKDVTLVPYEPKLIDVEMLTSAHRRWLNEYNERIRQVVGSELKRQQRNKAYKWMMSKTEHIPLVETPTQFAYGSSRATFPHDLFLFAVTVSHLFLNELDSFKV